MATADWSNPFWTNKQHVASELARRQHKVLYIDSIGLRRPTASRQDFRRMAFRILKALRPPSKVSPNIWVWSPIAIPFQEIKVIRWINKAFLSTGLLLWMRILKIEKDILWTYNPMTTELLPVDVFQFLVYHCVDEIKVQPGMPQEKIENSENDLLAKANICFVTSLELLQSRQRLNPNTFYFPNVADFRHFSVAMSNSLDIPRDVRDLKQPIIGFIGAISPYKLDLALIRRVAQLRPEWNIVMIGKVGEGEPTANVDLIRGLPNVHILGPRTYGSLPAYLKAFAVAILPSAINEYTRAMFPMKFFEYLAAGRPVVATKLHALQDYEGVASLVEGEDAFVLAIEAALSGGGAPLEDRLKVARQQTYEVRTDKMLAIISELANGL